MAGPILHGRQTFEQKLSTLCGKEVLHYVHHVIELANAFKKFLVFVKVLTVSAKLIFFFN